MPFGVLAQTVGIPLGIHPGSFSLSEMGVCSNKGASIVAAIRMLDQILERMQRHQRKRRSLLPDVPAWRGFAGEAV